MPSSVLDLGSSWANVGKQAFQGQSMYDQGRLKSGQMLAQQNALDAQAGLNNTKADEIRRRAQYQSPEFASKIAASFAGLTDPQANQLSEYTQNGNWGMSPARADEAAQMTVAPHPLSAPDFFTPEVKQRFNQGRAAVMANLGATGDTNGKQLTDAFIALAQQGNLDKVINDPSQAGAVAQGYAAIGGKPLYHAGPNGTMQLFTGAETLNDVGRSAAMENRAQAGNAASSAALHRVQAQALADTNSQGLEGFTPGAIDAAAARYNIDGTLPPMGYGKAGATGRKAILNRAAEMAGESNLSHEDQRIIQIRNKANTSALSKTQQQQSMVGSYELNFKKSADIALELSNKVDRSGVPIANKWINAGKRSIAGDPDLAAFDQAIKSTSNEYAKIISGSMGNTPVAESEIKKTESLLNAAQTPEQVMSVIALMKRETGNRMIAFDEEKAQLINSMKASKPRSNDAPAKTSSVDQSAVLSEARAAIAKGAPRAAVIERLRKNGITNAGL